MADNINITPGTGAKAATDEAAYSGDTVHAQIIELGYTTGSEGSRTLNKVTADSEGLRVKDTAGGSASVATPVTPSNSVSFSTNAHRLWVGGAGNVVVVLADDSTCTYTSVPAGTYLLVRCKRVNSTGTTATNIVAEVI